jgi:hypothetical protein
MNYVILIFDFTFFLCLNYIFIYVLDGFFQENIGFCFK